MKAYLYRQDSSDTVRCQLCHHRCAIKAGRRGKCRVRENRSGTLHSLVYGKLIARHVDPIEKKPLYHVMPGSLSYSIATVGCNFKCLFCQNADIAQLPRDHSGLITGTDTKPEAIVAAAQTADCRSIAYTYTEPTIYFEFAHDTARLARQAGIKNVFVTNGYMTPEALEMISPYLDAANVDLKAFNEAYYRDVCGAELEHVKTSLTRIKALNIWLEVTTLIVPGLNDNPEELQQMAEFITQRLGPETPWHLSRFHPTYRMVDRPPTPVSTLTMARDIGLAAGLRYVYTGNVPGDEGQHTNCFDCGCRLIQRHTFQARVTGIDGGRCRHCGEIIDGIDL